MANPPYKASLISSVASKEPLPKLQPDSGIIGILKRFQEKELAMNNKLEVKRQVEAALLNSECSMEEAIIAALQGVACVASYEGTKHTFGEFVAFATEAMKVGWSGQLPSPALPLLHVAHSPGVQTPSKPVTSVGPCGFAVPGYKPCTRASGHEGPCAHFMDD